jgi:hypothetical protein
MGISISWQIRQWMNRYRFNTERRYFAAQCHQPLLDAVSALLNTAAIRDAQRLGNASKADLDAIHVARQAFITAHIQRAYFQGRDR